MTSVENFPARVVVVGEKEGRSFVEKEYDSHTRAETPTFSVADIWAFEDVPTTVVHDDDLDGEVKLEPARGGLLVRMVAFPPDDEWKGTDAYAAALEAIGGSEAHGEGEDDGMHVTDTVDVVTLVSGEIYALFDDGETLLKSGDSLIQRGTRHAWSNRSDTAAVIVATQISAIRDERQR